MSRRSSSSNKLGPAGRVFIAIIVIGAVLTGIARTFMMAGTPEIHGRGLVDIHGCQRTEVVMQACLGRVVDWQGDGRATDTFVDVISYTPLDGKLEVVERDRWVSHHEGDDEVFEKVPIVVPAGLWLPTRWLRNVILIPTLIAFIITAFLASDVVRRREERRNLRASD